MMLGMNWVETIALLEKAGYTQIEIATACGCAQSTISDLATGKTRVCRFDIGIELKTLAAKARRKLANAERQRA
jgi:transcriptional regulator with XRE-family HTH domain